MFTGLIEQQGTTLGQLKIDQRLNVEFNYLTRIVAHQLKIVGQLKTEVRA